MKLVMTLLVRDEIDIIESNLLHHLSNGVDTIIITDNGSTDGTQKICQRFLGCGVGEIINEPGKDFSQYEYVSKMANLAVSKYSADWIMHVDADEFFISRTHLDIKDALSSVSQQHDILEINRHDFVPTKRNTFSFDPLDFPYRKNISLALSGKRLPPKIIHRASSNIRVSQGNHSASGDQLNIKTKTNDIEVLHFPIRSYNQFKSKVKNGGGGYAKNQVLSDRTGYHKRYWYNLLMNNELEKEFEKHFFEKQKLEEALANNYLVEDYFLASQSHKNLKP